MSDPTPYSRTYSFTDYQAGNPSAPLPGIQVDNELENVEQSLGEAIDAIKDVRRSDGKLKNGIVTVDSLSPQVAAGVGAGALASAEAAAASADAAGDSAVAAAASATAASGSATAASGYASNALTSRNEAETERTLAQTARTGAQTARDYASKWATEAEGVDVDDGVNPVGKSSYHWAQVALGAATGALPDNSVSTSKIVDGAVTRAKLATAVTDELDGLATGIAGKADAADTTAALALKANSADVYTKAATPISMAKAPSETEWLNGTTIRVKPAWFRDETDTVNIVIPSNIDIVLSGAPVSDHRHVLAGIDGSGNPAAVFATSVALPSGWQSYRRIWSVRTDAAGAIREYKQYGDRSAFATALQDLSGTTAVNALYYLPFPTGVPVDVRCRLLAFTNAAYLTLASPDEASPSNTSSGSLASLYTPGAVATTTLDVPSTTGQLRLMVNAATSWRVSVLGWLDRRGRDK